MTDSPSLWTAPPAAVTPVVVGFLSVVADGSGFYGGYLLTNSWGRPLEFRVSSAVHPTRVQQILYGPTLNEYLHADLIGKTLIEKASTLPGLIVTDTLAALAAGDRVGVPAVSVAPGDGPDTFALSTPRAGSPVRHRAGVSDAAVLRAVLDHLDPALDLAEPFARIREALLEARKAGGAARAA